MNEWKVYYLKFTTFINENIGSQQSNISRLSRVICGNLVTTNDNLVQNVVQTCQFVLTIEYNQPTQNKSFGFLFIR